ncbi:MAG TPA: Fe-S cluster assembly protein SufB, partial [Bacteroidales bacterium]|nr:Fe-S cluster assembly protein SufB [Bacteroidales bacterium]
MKEDQDKVLKDVTESEYKYGFVTEIEADEIPKGLNEETVRLISKKKNEPEWLLEFRLKAFAKWKTMTMPTWAHLEIPEIKYQDIIYYSAPKQQAKYQSI